MRTNFELNCHAAAKTDVKTQVAAAFADVLLTKPEFGPAEETVIATANAMIDLAKEPDVGQHLFILVEGMQDSWSAGSPPPLDQLRLNVQLVVTTEP